VDIKMTKIELLSYLTAIVREYRKNCNKSINVNKHMNELNGKAKIKQKVIDAILVDFINYVGINQGVDYGLYTNDIKDKI
jgi:hypothetical protein